MRPRFSLRLFLIAFTLLAILIGDRSTCASQAQDQDKRHDEAAAKLAATPGVRLALTAKDVSAASRSKSVKERLSNPNGSAEILSLYAVQPDAEVKARLIDAGKLRGVRLVYVKMTLLDVTTLELLKQLKDLRQLRLRCEEMDEETAFRLHELPSLESLNVKSPLSDQSIASIAKLSALENLDCDASLLTAKGADSLGSMARTTKAPLEIHLRAKTPSPEVFEAISKLGGEVELQLHAMTMSDVEMPRLKSGKSIVKLEFDDCQLTTSLWPTIAAMPQLQHLWIRNGAGANPSDHAIDLRSCLALETIKISPCDAPGVEVHTFKPPPNLKYVCICGKTRFAALKQILATAPNCEVDCETPDDNNDTKRGSCFRLYQGKIQSYEYHRTQDLGIDILHRGVGVPPPWKDVKEAMAF